MRRSAALLVLLASLALAPALRASAGTISIGFDFSQSSLSILGGLIDIPPSGAITSASATIDVPGSGLATPEAGVARLRSLTLAGTLDATVLGMASLSGSLDGMQVGTAEGSLTAGLANLFFQSAVLSLSVFVDCTPTAVCDFVADFPIQVTGPQTFSPFGTLPIAGLDSPGNALVTASVEIVIAGLSATLSLVGNEVSRTFVPEPGSFGLVAAGLAGLAAAFRLRPRG